MLSLLLGLKSSFRWFLSGTPSHATFRDVQDLAALLGVHLGVDETIPGTKLGGRGRRAFGRESTGLESLSVYLETRSMQWHEHRHEIAQRFLDRFVRQNKAEHDEIPCVEHRITVDLPAAERAIYLELETHLKSLEMNNRNAQKSKQRSRGDRDSRMQQILEGSSTAEEALLKCCSHFGMSSERSTVRRMSWLGLSTLLNHCQALETIKDIIRLRQSQLRDLESELTGAISSAARAHDSILHLQPDWLYSRRSEKGEVDNSFARYRKDVEERDSVPHGADDEIHERIALVLSNALSERASSSDCSQDSVIEGLSPKRKRTKAPTGAPQPESLYGKKIALRNHLHIVRSMGKEVCGRVRSLRYVEWVQRFQDTTLAYTCPRCKREGLSVSTVGVLSCCGHMGCLSCLAAQAAEGKCIEAPSCSARVSAAHVVSSAHLGLDRGDTVGGRFGRKLTSLVEKVEEIIASGDRLIVFCQFDDLKDKIVEALSDRAIDALQVRGSVAQQIKTLSVFQKEEPDEGDPRVLLLKLDDEQSAGLNLTNLNHAIFVHPLLANSQAEYDAYETQAIGRIRRYGQTKTVHIHRFLARDTIDTEIFGQRASQHGDAQR